MNTVFCIMEQDDLLPDELCGVDILSFVGVTYEVVFMEDGAVHSEEININ